MAARRSVSARGRHAQGVQSVEIGFRILDALAKFGHAAPLREIARATGLSVSATHRYLVSLGRAGIVVQERRGGSYDLGPGVLQLGFSALRRLDSHGYAAEALLRLHEAVGHTAGLFVWGARGPTIVRWKEADASMTVNARPGHALPTTASASGRIFAAFLPARLVQPFVAEELSSDRPGKARFEEALRRARRKYLAEARGEIIPGIDALAAPVFDHEGDIKFALAVWGSSLGLDVGIGAPVSRTLLSVAEELSRRLGYSGRFPSLDAGARRA